MIDYARPGRQQMLADFRGQRSANKFAKFLDTYGSVLLGAAVVAVVWVWVGVLSPQTYSMADMHAYAESYYNWAINH